MRQLERSVVMKWKAHTALVFGTINRGLALSSSYATSYHAPVMWKECIDALLDCERTEARVFIDATLGGGGHSAALLQRLQSDDILIGCDVDPQALETASERLAKYTVKSSDHPLFVPVQSNFADLVDTVTELSVPDSADLLLPDGKVDGILMDLGVSSHQIDSADRGFAFQQDGPLDMRMGQNAGSLTASDICNEWDEDSLRRIFMKYGDEPRARKIANAIIERRPLRSTQDLVDVVASVVPQFAKKGKRMGRTSTLARVFQSLRIVVNQEDIVLERALSEMCPTLIRPGGRLVVLSYHSMEDRATKRIMRDGCTEKRKTERERDIYGNLVGPPLPFRPVGKRQKATDDEVALNSRARSATLRVAERQDESRLSHAMIK